MLLILKNYNFVIIIVVIFEMFIIVLIMIILFGKMKFKKNIVLFLYESKEISDNYGEWIDK